ncbi:glycosyltransferase family 2 protein [Dyella psychrodurans]|uniref:Glycosyltransferase family 2 protein n=1 Tax=Dyella psychrodurans TaxID=1927960 RepID=A0A370X560_9GAMM|nr:glycosyltransferase family 2 protein [Dyella psychrodurans]RDS83400.1 glycosyltransferase family 2 protein [Dyella psychrodurans]
MSMRRGILDLIRARLRPWYRKLRGNAFLLHPIGQLSRLSPSGNTWRSKGSDPKFACVSSCYPLRAGWYSFSIELEVLDGGRLWPMLYFDFGHGMHEAWSRDLNFVRSGVRRHRGVVLLSHDVHDMRFDPADAPCTFHVGKLNMKRIARPRAAWLMLRALKSRRSESGTGFEENVYMEAMRRLRSSRDRRAFATWLYGLYTWRKETKPVYQAWLNLYDGMGSTVSAATGMLISILMPTYNTPEKWLRNCLDSVLAQSYANWELCIADDASTASHVRKVLETYSQRDSRIRVHWRDCNGHVSAATNTALDMARGDYLALLDHDDELHPLALSSVVRALQQNPHWQMVYSDEDKIDEEGRRYDPYFKPDWNLELMHGQNCFSHLGVYSTSLVRAVGGFREGFEGSQDWDLALRCSERLDPGQIGHIPKVLYHWRAIAGSTAKGVEQKGYAHHAGLRALQDHLRRLGTAAEVMEIEGLLGLFRVRHPVPDDQPMVSIVIPTRDKMELLRRCVDSILERTTYKNYEIVVVDNQSSEDASLDYLRSISEYPRVRILKHDHPFNYSRINNEAVKHCHGKLICLLNNDIEVITPGWLEELVGHALRPMVGAVGAMLYYPNDTIQHAGVIVGVHGVAAHPYSARSRGYNGQMGRARLTQAMSAVTAACLVVRKDVFERMGGLDESLQVAFNDVDFCLRLRQHGYTNVWTPFAELYHWESASRGVEDTSEKQDRFDGEVNFMVGRWSKQLRADPYYNPNLTLSGEPFTLAFPPRDGLFIDAEEQVELVDELLAARGSRAAVGVTMDMVGMRGAESGLE